MKKIMISLFFSTMIYPTIVWAQINAEVLGQAQNQLNTGAIGAGLTTAEGAKNPLDPRILAAQIIQVILGVLGTLFVGLIVLSGFRLIKADGDSTKIEQAKDTLQKAIIGIVIILSAFSLATFVSRTITKSINEAGPKTGFQELQ